MSFSHYPNRGQIRDLLENLLPDKESDGDDADSDEVDSLYDDSDAEIIENSLSSSSDDEKMDTPAPRKRTLRPFLNFTSSSGFALQQNQNTDNISSQENIDPFQFTEDENNASLSTEATSSTLEVHHDVPSTSSVIVSQRTNPLIPETNNTVRWSTTTMRPRAVRAFSRGRGRPPTIPIVARNAIVSVPTAAPTTARNVNAPAPATAPSVAPTAVPTAARTAPTAKRISPTVAPTAALTTAPTAVPTAAPTTAPTVARTAPTATRTAPTTAPTAAPTVARTAPPAAPTVARTAPTAAPTAVPTVARTAPTAAPTVARTAPTTAPTVVRTGPTAAPTIARNALTAARTAAPTVARTAPTAARTAPTAARTAPTATRTAPTAARQNTGRNAEPQSQDTYVAKDQTVWGKQPPASGRARSCNIRRDNGARTNIPHTIAIVRPVNAFMLFLQPIIQIIVMYTNLKAETVHAEKSYKTRWVPVDEVEIKAFIGILLLQGILHQSKRAVITLWDVINGTNIYRAVMSLHRFKQILRYMRFDDPLTRDRTQKFAPIREVFDIVNNLFTLYYIPGDNITIDEQLSPYRGRCSFRQYMPSKPDKYGIKFWHATDSETYYPLNCAPYLGKEGDERAVGLGSSVVLSLTEPYFNTGRNVTCDNFFTSLELARTLLNNGLTIIGTLKSNKTYLPDEFKPNRTREVGSSVFGFKNDATIVSFVPKKHRSVALLSTMHHDDKVDAVTGKPEIILDYNATKGGVDTLDQMLHTYTCKRSIRRWPMVVFFNLIDLMGIASYVIFCKEYSNWNIKKKYRRRLFLNEVAVSLVEDQIKRRYQTCRTKIAQRAMMRVIHEQGIEVAPQAVPAAAVATRKRERCYICTYKKDRKTNHHCFKCLKPICGEHAVVQRSCANDCQY